MSIKKLIHSKEFAIRWGDMDAYGHLNNTMYFFYAQEARFELLKDNGIIVDLRGKSPILASTSCQFKRPITYPETIIVETWLIAVEHKKVFFEHLIKSSIKEEIIYAEIEALIMWFDFAAGKSVVPPDSARAALGL